MNCESIREQLLTGAPMEDVPHLDECAGCREFSDALDLGWGELDRGLEQWSQGGDFEGVFARAIEGRPANNNLWYTDRRFHGFLIAIAAVFAIFLATTTRPEPTPAVLPDPVDWSDIEDRVEEVDEIPWNALSDQDWSLKAMELREDFIELDEAGARDDEELAELLFLVATQIGRAAENANNPSPPFYDLAEEKKVVNWYWWEAAGLAVDDPTLMDLVENDDIAASVNYYVKMRGP